MDELADRLVKDAKRSNKCFSGEPDDLFTSSVAVAFASTLVGFIFVWTLGRLWVPGVEGWVLAARYLVYAVLLSILYRAGDACRGASIKPFTPFSGLSAATIALSPFLKLFGVPLLWMLTFAACFKVGYGFAVCWTSRQGDLCGEIRTQVASYSKTIFLVTSVMLLFICEDRLLLFILGTSALQPV